MKIHRLKDKKVGLGNGATGSPTNRDFFHY